MVVIESLLSVEEVAAFVESLSQQPWQDGKVTAMGMASDVKRNGQADKSAPGVKQLANQLLQRMGNTPSLVSAALPQKIFPPCFNRYCEGETYGYHVDAAIMRLPDSQDVLRSDMSMTLFLNDPQDYDGGELVIATAFGEQRVKLPAGHAVVYPSSSLHKVTPVTRGERLAAISWMQSMVADATVRSTLYDLDQSIQTLMENEHVERASLDRLHHVYHNLIRQFSQV